MSAPDDDPDDLQAHAYGAAVLGFNTAIGTVADADRQRDVVGVLLTVVVHAARALDVPANAIRAAVQAALAAREDAEHGASGGRRERDQSTAH